MYKLEYLPVATRDMAEIARYISHVLFNPAAAEKLAVEMTEAAERLMDFPYRCPVYTSQKPLQKEYRKLLVGNYILFYSVDEVSKLVTIARVLYARRDYEKHLK
jgi:plasmid stabilization system protein ParE